MATATVHGLKQPLSIRQEWLLITLFDDESRSGWPPMTARELYRHAREMAEEFGGVGFVDYSIEGLRAALVLLESRALAARTNEVPTRWFLTPAGLRPAGRLWGCDLTDPPPAASP